MRLVASRVVSTKLSDPTSDFRPFVQLSGGITVRTCKREFLCGPRHPIDCGFHWGRSPDHIIPPMADRGKRNTASDRSPRIERAGASNPRRLPPSLYSISASERGQASPFVAGRKLKP